MKNDNRKQNTIASYATKKFGMSIKDFYCVFVRTEINLIVFSGPQNCVNMQYAALSGAMVHVALVCTIFSQNMVILSLVFQKKSFTVGATYSLL